MVSGHGEEALKEFRTGLDLMRKVVLAKPLDLRARRNLATTYEEVGRTLLLLGRIDEAVEAQEANVRIAEAVAASDPANIQRQAQLSSSYDMYLQALDKAGRTEQAENILEKLVAIREKVARADPDNIRAQLLLGIAYYYKGISLSDKKNRAEALAYHRKGLGIYKKLNLLDPDNVDWNNNLALAYGAVGRVLRQTGQLQEALKNSDEQIKLAERVSAKAPNDPYYARNLAATYSERGKLLFAFGRPEEALSFLDESLRMAASEAAALDAPKEHAWVHWFRGMARLYLNEPELALQDMQAAFTLDPQETYHAISLHIARNRLAQEDSEELAANATKLDRTKWPSPLVSFFMGQSSLEELKAAARAGDEESTRAEHRCEADFYAGLSRMNAPAEARALLQSAAQCPQHVAEDNWAPLFAALFVNQLDAQARQATAIAIVQCDRLAASNLDPERPASVPGISVAELKPNLAVPACEAALKVAPDDRRIVYQLGRAYGQAENYEKARELYERADALGHALATNNLGALYADGKGVEPNLAEARRLYEKAAARTLRSRCQMSGSSSSAGRADRKTPRRRGTGTRKLPRAISRMPPINSGSFIRTVTGWRRI